MRYLHLVGLLMYPMACVAEPAAADRLVLKGYFDVALPEGAVVLDDCSTFHMPEPPSPRVCFEIAVDEVEEPAWPIINELTSQGWEWGSGAANVLWVERHISESCIERLNVIGLIDGPEDEIAKWGGKGESEMDGSRITGVYVLAPEMVGRCDRNRG